MFFIIKNIEMEVSDLIVIAAAAEEEIKHLKKNMIIKEIIKDGKAIFFKGQIEETEAVLVKTGIGSKKARAAISKAIERFNPPFIILIGAAGAVNPQLNIGDIVVVDVIKEMHGKNLSTYQCSKALNKKAMAILIQEGLYAIQHNSMVFSNFIHLRQEKDAIMKNHEVMVIDMESSGIAKEASLKNIPLINIRIVSDTARENTLNVEKLYREKKNRGFAGLILYFIFNPREFKKALLLRKHLFTVSEKILIVTKLLLKNSLTDIKKAPDV